MLRVMAMPSGGLANGGICEGGVTSKEKVCYQQSYPVLLFMDVALLLILNLYFEPFKEMLTE